MTDSNLETTKKIVEVHTKDLEKFISLYPQRGAWTWFVREALHRFVALHSTENKGELLSLAVNELNLNEIKS